MQPVDLPPLDESAVPAAPFPLFDAWINLAVAAALPEPYAVTLATALPDGSPSARLVLLRGFDERGFVFFTNYLSRKGGELAANPKAALVFFWAPFSRQVRIEGRVEKTTDKESDAYFHSRPVGHRLGAFASPQSQVLPGRRPLEEKMAEMERTYANGDMPRPDWWGGYRVVPDVIEFWQGQLNRLHDRIRYRRVGADWVIERLAP
ncbi:MAG: pyridoxamine 5'-phosphate oxidase [Gemmataceae bacterium]